MPEIRRDEWAQRASYSPDDFETDAEMGADTERPGRQAADVLEDHLRAVKQDRLEEDLAENFANDVVIISGAAVYHGHDGVRRCRQELANQVPSARFAYLTQKAEGEAAMVEWQARGQDSEVDDGVESFIIRNGRIVAQTIHYTVRHTT